MKQLTISRWNGEGEISLDIWKDLISSLVLCGYEIYGDEKQIVFVLGDEDEVKEVK